MPKYSPVVPFGVSKMDLTLNNVVIRVEAHPAESLEANNQGQGQDDVLEIVNHPELFRFEAIPGGGGVGGGCDVSFGKL